MISCIPTQLTVLNSMGLEILLEICISLLEMYKPNISLINLYISRIDSQNNQQGIACITF
jgi:hypothetical protein